MADFEQNCSSRSSSRASSFTLCHLADSAYAKVVFCDISDSYAVYTDVECLYQLSESVVPKDGDYIGLFRVGWVDLKECITTVLCSSSSCDLSTSQSYHKVVFRAEDLPEDLEYYQFLYLTDDQEICGASTPFRFHSLHEEENFFIEEEHDFVEVKSSTSVLQHQLVETRKYVVSLQKERKGLGDKIDELEEENEKIKADLEHQRAESRKYSDLEKEKEELENKITRIEKENKENKSKLEKVHLSKHEEYEKQLHAWLLSIVERREAPSTLPACSADLGDVIICLRAVVDGLSKCSASLKQRNMGFKDELSKAKEAAARKGTLQRRESTCSTCLKEGYKELKEERSTLQKELEVAKDLFHASEQCKSLLLRKLEEAQNIKDEMTSRLDDLKLLNTLLKKQVDSNENSIKELKEAVSKKEAEKSSEVAKIGKVVKDNEELARNFQVAKETWKKQQNENYREINDLSLRLKEAAELYKKQFLEIQNLKKQLKAYKLSRSRSMHSNDESTQSECEKCLFGDPDLLFEGFDTSHHSIRTPMSSSVNSDTFSKVENEMFDSLMKEMGSVSHSETPVQKASALSNEAIADCITMSHCETLPQSFHLSSTNDTAGLGHMASNSEPSSSSIKDAKQNRVLMCDDSLQKESSFPETYDLPCPLCDESITVSGHSTSMMDNHLLEVHNQQLCPVCGRLFDRDLPSNYFKYHVENHFTTRLATNE